MVTHISPRIRYLQAITSADMGDILTLQRDTAYRVLSDARCEVLRVITETNPESITALADQLDRPLTAVHRDVEILFEADVLDYEDGPNNANKPVLAHQTILMEPLVFEGEPLAIGQDHSETETHE